MLTVRIQNTFDSLLDPTHGLRRSQSGLGFFLALNIHEDQCDQQAALMSKKAAFPLNLICMHVSRSINGSNGANNLTKVSIEYLQHALDAGLHTSGLLSFCILSPLSSGETSEPINNYKDVDGKWRPQHWHPRQLPITALSHSHWWGPYVRATGWSDVADVNVFLNGWGAKLAEWLISPLELRPDQLLPGECQTQNGEGLLERCFSELSKLLNDSI